MKIAIVGAGIGGLTLALELHDAGIGCDIYEAAPEIRPIGEPDKRMLIHPQALFHVPLCQGARGQVHALWAPGSGLLT